MTITGRTERSTAGWDARRFWIPAAILLLCHHMMTPCQATQAAQVSDAGGRDLWMHGDGTYEWAYAWAYEGCQPPDYGPFAERYEGCGQITAIVLDVTDDFYQYEEHLDAYVWANEQGVPGEVLAVELDVHLAGVPQWPSVGRFFVDLTEPPYVDGVWWVGFWGRWPHIEPAFYIGADQDGPGGGSPKTKITPGQGYPEGWQDVPEEWGPTAALGIGAEVDETPSPVTSKTWGAIKDLFR